MNSHTNQDDLAEGQRWDADSGDVFPIRSIYKHGDTKVIFVLDGQPDWGLISLKKWAEQIGIHYHTARKLKDEGKICTTKVGAQDFLTIGEARRIAREGAS